MVKLDRHKPIKEVIHEGTTVKEWTKEYHGKGRIFYISSRTIHRHIKILKKQLDFCKKVEKLKIKYVARIVEVDNGKIDNLGVQTKKELEMIQTELQKKKYQRRMK